MSFARLRAVDWVAFIAALALLLATAPDWYSTRSGEEARRIEELAAPTQVENNLRTDAAAVAEGEERNAWQPDSLVDLLVLLGLLAISALGILAAYTRAAGRPLEPLGPTGLAGLAAAVTSLFVLYRTVQEPGLDEATTVQAGVPLALLLLGTIALASGFSVQADSQRADLPSARHAT